MRRFASLPLTLCLAVPVTAGAVSQAARAQTAPAKSDPVAQHWVEAAVAAQLYSDSHDIAWTFRERHRQGGHESVMIVADTPHGGERRTIEIDGRPVTAAEAQAETDRINAFANDPAAQARKRRDEVKDDQESSDLLRAWPQAFLVSIASETPEFVTLNYWPNPSYDAPSIEGHVMSQMQGQIVIKRAGSQIYTVRGRLTRDISVAFGFVKLKAGGTFSVERREILPGRWQLVEQHTHIQGHAVLFKSISEQEDDWKSDFKPSPAKTMLDAARILNAGH